MSARRPIEPSPATSHRGIHTRGPKAKINPNDALLVQCWCRSKMAYIDPAIIMEGKTWACDKPRCKEPT